ncbi:protein of unknown function (plasmid) [Azospirillum baldaniorum]|uniref:Uncharacterized protein n=1 Tax=Azospirillum baldaniorum TaxID=1064539 RepID=A0A9P1JZB7_9PROT|nr:protein of unknown function [Azospirillum baldaniorum]
MGKGTPWPSGAAMGWDNSIKTINFCKNIFLTQKILRLLTHRLLIK